MILLTKPRVYIIHDVLHKSKTTIKMDGFVHNETSQPRILNTTFHHKNSHLTIVEFALDFAQKQNIALSQQIFTLSVVAIG